MATTKSNYSVLHAERDVMKHRQYGDGDCCSTSIGCRKKSTDETVLVGITRVHVCTHTDRYVYAHVARVTAFGTTELKLLGYLVQFIALIRTGCACV